LKSLVKSISKNQETYDDLNKKDKKLKEEVNSLKKEEEEKERQKQYLEGIKSDIEILRTRIHENQNNLKTAKDEIAIQSKRYKETNDRITRLKENLKSKEDLATEKDRIKKEIIPIQEKQQGLSNIISQIPIFELQFSRIESQIEDFTSSKNRKVMDLDKHKSFLDENSDLILPTDKTNEQLREEQRKIDELINEEE
jgi:chromosome segregation ATPase